MTAAIRKAAPAAKLLARRLLAAVYRYVDDELEKRCNKCNEYWPADSEFFYSEKGKGDGLSNTCKACYVENRFPTGRGSVGHQLHARTA